MEPIRELVDGVLVVGAGLGGLTLAAALRARRVPAEVFEARESLDEVPACGVCLWGGALRALDGLGMLSVVTSRGAPIERLRLWSGTGRTLLDVSARDAAIEGLAIRVDRLHEALRKEAEGVPVHTGRRLLGYSQDQRGVMLELRDGYPVRGPIAVGADGVRSVVRLQCLDDGPAPYSGDSVWEGTVPTGIERGTLNVYWGPYGVRAGMVAIERDATAWWVDAATGSGLARQNSHAKPELRALLADLRWPVRDLVEATPEAEIVRREVMARRRARLTGSGPVTLLGDAAHPLPISMRLGPSLTIEDAAALAEALAGEPDAVEALRAYERARVPRVASALEGAWRLRALEAREHGLATRARDLAIKLVPEVFAGGFLSRLLAGHIEGPGPRLRPAWRHAYAYGGSGA